MRNLVLTNPLTKGDDVERVQKQLGVFPDGRYGRDTRKAVRAWQWRTGLARVSGGMSVRQQRLLLEIEAPTAQERGRAVTREGKPVPAEPVGMARGSHELGQRLIDCHPLPGSIYREGGGPGVGTHHHDQNWQSSSAVDLLVPAGSRVVAVLAGRIVRAGALQSTDPRLLGLRVGLQAANHALFYAHLSTLDVAVGDVVVAGDVLGHSGAANGVDHLHFALTAGDYDDDGETRSVNPVPLVRAHAEVLSEQRLRGLGLNQ
jgi:murein DD-endopeptidase MepM/ murein hydrolase activator NlpD